MCREERRKMTRSSTGIARTTALCVALILSACAGEGGTLSTPTPPSGSTTAPATVEPTPTEYRLTGHVHLMRGAMHEGLAYGRRCWGAENGGYNDINAGAQVVVRSESGAVIGTGTLGEGEMDSPDGCAFPFTVGRLPNAAFYTIEVANRDGPSYSFDDLEREGWEVRLSIGG
ncbi:hypothetical protein [Microbacterium sp.]|uniref:hypothetical protein n=1 Tax=Microbacterium sp. TaxID=51671 RepID=UPI0031FF0977|nr:hypothetical protein [Microbacterium sp.]